MAFRIRQPIRHPDVDRAGIVRASFEGVVTEAELRAAIAEIAGS